MDDDRIAEDWGGKPEAVLGDIRLEGSIRHLITPRLLLQVKVELRRRGFPLRFDDADLKILAEVIGVLVVKDWNIATAPPDGGRE